MASSTKTALIFGAGANVGSALVKGFLGSGYRVATVSRSKHASPASGDTLSLQADMSDPSAVPGVFRSVGDAGWAFPSVVMYGAEPLFF